MKTWGRVSSWVLLSALMLALAGVALGQEKYPSRPIEYVVGWGVGGGADQMARALVPLLEKLLGVSIAVVNVPGASGNTALAKVAAAKADGYTIYTSDASTPGTLAMGTSPYKLEDFQWVSRFMLVPSFLFVRTDDKRFGTWDDLVKYAKANPGKLTVALTGIGTTEDVTVRYLTEKGIPMRSVPYAKPGERYASVIGGHEDILYEQAGDITQYLEAKQLRPIIAFTDKRLPDFPDVPAAGEVGLEVRFPQFRYILIKGGTPPDRVKVLADAFRKAADTAEWKKHCERNYCAPGAFLGPDEFAKWIREEIETTRAFAKRYGIMK